MSKITFVCAIVLLAVIGSASCYGGFVNHKLTDEVRERGFKLMAGLEKENNAILTAILKASPEIVSYSTQLVAGLNHGLILKISGLQESFACVRIYEKWDQSILLVQAHLATSQAEAASKCGIPTSA